MRIPAADSLARRLLSAPARTAWRALLLLTMLAVCALAFDPKPPAGIDTGWDKSNHLLAFAVLAMLAELSFWTLPRRRFCNTVGLLVFGSFIELVQTQVPGRSGEWPDLLADAAGIGTGLLVLAVLLKWLQRPGP